MLLQVFAVAAAKEGLAICNSHEGRLPVVEEWQDCEGGRGPPVWNHTKWGKSKMALESKSKEGGKEGREKSLATIEMESCYLREGEGRICRIETFARHRLSTG